MNKINLIGRTTNDIELKTTTSGKSVCNFDIAVKRPYAKDTTDFFTCVVWGNKAEIMSKYVKKGQLIGVSGYGYNRKWQDKNGNNRISFEINVEDFDFCENKGQSNNTNNDPLNEFANDIKKMNDDADFDNVVDDDGDLPFL